MNKEAKPKSSSPLVLCILALLMVYFGLSVIQTLYHSYENRGRLQALANHVQALQQRQHQLQDQLVYQQSEAFIEREARNKLQMMKDGEVVVIFPETAGAFSQQSPGTKDDRSQPNILPDTIRSWQRLFWP